METRHHNILQTQSENHDIGLWKESSFHMNHDDSKLHVWPHRKEYRHTNFLDFCPVVGNGAFWGRRVHILRNKKLMSKNKKESKRGICEWGGCSQIILGTYPFP